MPMIGNVYAYPRVRLVHHVAPNGKWRLTMTIFSTSGVLPPAPSTTFIQCVRVEEVFTWLRTGSIWSMSVCLPSTPQKKYCVALQEHQGASRSGPGFFWRLMHARLLFELRNFIVELLVNCGNVARAIFGMALRLNNESDHKGR